MLRMASDQFSDEKIGLLQVQDPSLKAWMLLMSKSMAQQQQTHEQQQQK